MKKSELEKSPLAQLLLAESKNCIDEVKEEYGPLSPNSEFIAGLLIGLAKLSAHLVNKDLVEVNK